MSKDVTLVLRPWEAQLLSVLLEMASDEFGNHGCNDFDLQTDGHIYDPEIWREIDVAFNDFNGTPEYVSEKTNRYQMDYALMNYLKAKVDAVMENESE